MPACTEPANSVGLQGHDGRSRALMGARLPYPLNLSRSPILGEITPETAGGTGSIHDDDKLSYADPVIDHTRSSVEMPKANQASNQRSR